MTMQPMFVVLRDLSGLQSILVIASVVGGLIVLSTLAKWLGRKVSARMVEKGKTKQAARAVKISKRKDKHLEHILDNQEILK